MPKLLGCFIKMNKKDKIGIFFSSGIGNAILMVPFINALLSQNKELHIVGIFDSPYKIEDLFWDESLLHEKIILDSSIKNLSIFSKYGKFHTIYLDYFSVTRKNILWSLFMADTIVAHQKKVDLPAFVLSKINFIEVHPNQHMIDINLALMEEEHLLYYKVDYTLPKPPVSKAILPSKSFISIQISSGNNKTPYKTWPFENWKNLIKEVMSEFPTLDVIVLGDETEKALGQTLSYEIPQIHNRVGKTSLVEAANVLQNSLLFIGHDSGLMHIAASLKTPTLTVWGGSDFNLYGYHSFEPEHHQIIFHKISCHPCNSWINPNTSRVFDPLACPDFKCIRQISVLEVFEKCKEMISPLLSNS